jgi:hypothetical protein
VRNEVKLTPHARLVPGDVTLVARSIICFHAISPLRREPPHREDHLAADDDKNNARVVLRGENSKNGEPRVLPLIAELAEIIARRREPRISRRRAARRRCRSTSPTAEVSRGRHPQELEVGVRGG